MEDEMMMMAEDAALMEEKAEEAPKKLTIEELTEKE